MCYSEVNGSAERLLGLSDGTRLCFELTGHRPSRSSWWRWHLTGRLEARRIGGRLYTTERSVRAMLAADEERNAGSANARGLAAARRIAALTERRSRRTKGGRG